MVSLATSTAYEEIGHISPSSSTPFETVSADDALSPSECASPSAPHSPKRPRNGVPVEDTLTCGSCLRDFSLSDITKFIDHKAINGCDFGHKKCKLDFAFTGDDDDSDCCSCIDFDLSSGNEKMATSPEASRTAQSYADSQVTEEPKELTDEKTLMVDVKETEENIQTDLENTNNAETHEEEKVEQAGEETAESVESMEIASTKSDDKENRPSGNHSESESVQSADSKKESNQIVLSELSGSNQEVSTSSNDTDESKVESSAPEEVPQSAPSENTVESDAAEESESKCSKSTTKRPVRTLQHNHFCRHYRRLCKHFQRSLLARALSDAHTNTGETETTQTHDAQESTLAAIHPRQNIPHLP